VGFILAAGVAASVAAFASLIRSHAREIRYSDAIASYFDAFGLPDPRPDALPRKPLRRETTRSRRFDGWLQGWAESWTLATYLLWAAALLLFALADVVAYVLTV
jgi:hypothetical protein